MRILTIHNYAGFVSALRQAGFSLGGENSDGIFTLCDYFSDEIRWHTGDRETDPWAFRMRVLAEETDIGYGKLFLKKGGYMTREWAPYFIALRREGRSFEETYDLGHMSRLEYDICCLVEKKEEAALHEIKAVVGEKGLEAALAKLQTAMYLTISGQTMRLSRENVPYGWPVTTFRLTEDFWGTEVMEKAANISYEEAALKISDQVRLLNPAVQDKALKIFLA